MSITRDQIVDLFDEHSVDIYDRFCVSQILYASLRRKGLISPAVEQDLKVAVRTDHEKIAIILKNVQDKGVKAFLDFCLVLANKKVDMEHIVIDVMALNLEDIQKQRDSFSVDSASTSASTSGAQAAAPAPPPAAPAVVAPAAPREESQFILQAVHRVSDEEALRLLSIPSVYPMKSKPRGKAIIINIEKYDNAAKNREGSHTDLVNLTLLLRSLDFHVDPWTNFDSQKIKEYIEKERLSLDHYRYDAFIMCVLSHGKRGLIRAADMVYLKIQEDLVNAFNGDNAPGLVNKPKMFFIQACQGNERTIGVAADGDPPGGSDQQPGSRTHEMADILVVNSTVEGYSAFRDITMGSFFMRDLVTVFTDRCHIDHVEDMVTEVARRLNERNIGGSLKQICNKQSNLTRKVYFLPRYSEL